MNELALFAGAGGGILGGHLLGWRTICAVEWEPYPASVLCARQNDGILPPYPIWDDVQTFAGTPWRGRVDVVSGGFPCQDISAAGKGAGIDGARSGMWFHMARIVRDVEPRFVFVENSPMLTSRGLGRVLGDLASMGYDARWGVLGAVDAGAPHKRARIWIVAHNSKHGWGSRWAGRLDPSGARQREQTFQDVADPDCQRRCSGSPWCEDAEDARQSSPSERRLQWWLTEPAVGRVAHGVAARVDRLKAIGNGQVPAVAALAWQILSADFTEQ